MEIPGWVAHILFFLNTFGLNPFILNTLKFGPFVLNTLQILMGGPLTSVRRMTAERQRQKAVVRYRER